MNHLFFLSLFILACTFVLPASSSDSSLSVQELRCEYQTNPLAIDTIHPRFSWILSSSLRNQKQTAYQIMVASDEENLKNDVGNLWDTGKVESDQSIQVSYEGKPLSSFQRCLWKIRVWDPEGRPSPWSEPAEWSMGILQDEDWQARWICRANVLSSENTQKNNPSLPIFRREFSVDKPVSRARVYICGLGFYELRLNGSKVGDSLFDSGWTNYRKTCLYAAYDVTRQIQSDENAFGVMLGNGMYNVPGGRYVKFTGSFGEPKFILRLHVEYADGTMADVVSDDTWQCTTGPIVFSCIYGGEDYDARSEQPDWDTIEFDSTSWDDAAPCEGPGGKLIAQTASPIRVMQELAPVQVEEPRPGTKIYDLGQNFSGIPSIQVRGARGTQIRITPAELITDEGLTNQSASGGLHYYTYILQGNGIETWQPRFSYYGFRYLQVESDPKDNPPELLSIKGLFTRNSANRVGHFECSSDLYNQIHELIDWSVGSNLQSFLTDCPHREKLGWLEVAHLMAPSILYNYDVPLFYNKVLRDIRDTQLENGLIPDIAPEYVKFDSGFRDSPEWGSAGVILPWVLYEWFGDKRALEENYDSMKRYVEYLSSRAQDHIVSHGLGDWFDYVRGGQVGESRLTPKSLTATAMYYHDAMILSESARILGKAEEALHYGNLAEAIRRSFNKILFQSETNQYAAGSQTANAIPLVWGLVDSNLFDSVLQNLVNEVTQRDYLTSGDVGFRFLIRSLADNGRSDLVYQLTHRTDEPGYGYQLKQGATSLTEAWDGRKVVSHNHCMLGHLQEWLHQDLLGIRRDPSGIAFQSIIIHPQIVGDITWAKGLYESPYGKIECHWTLENQKFGLQLSIPLNTTAVVYLPTNKADQITESGKPLQECRDAAFIRFQDEYAVYRIGSGDYRFESPYEKKGKSGIDARQ